MKKMTMTFSLLVAIAFGFTKMAQIQISTQQYHTSLQQYHTSLQQYNHAQQWTPHKKYS